MKVVALVSGGKDSCYNMMCCVAAGHDIVALANLVPHNKGELDSYMYQCVAHEGVALMGEAMGLPLYRMETSGQAHHLEKDYIPTTNDEVEDLYKLLQKVQEEMQLEGVAVGAILSDYQRIRVENVCSRLGLVSLAYLWQRDQSELLQEMIDSQVNAVVVKVATLGLDPKHLGKSISQLQPHLLNMKDKYGLNVCGEGGEYETFTLDCPLFVNTIVIDDSELVLHSDCAIAPVGYLRLNKLHLIPKNVPQTIQDRLSSVVIKNADGYITDPGEEAFENADPKEEDDETESFETNEEVCVEHPVTHATTNTGWLWCGGITGYGTTVQEGMEQALEKLESCLTSENFTITNICSINMFIRNMLQYPLINKIYSHAFSAINPPTRVCVEAPLPKNCHILMEILAWKAQQSEPIIEKHTLHVQGISHWAPANIGPYSQAIRVQDIICVAGQIGLVPGDMSLVKGGIRQQCQLSLRHIGRIVKAIEPSTQLRDVVQDEETGKCVNNFSISIRRRWNYENNVAAIVCHVGVTEPMSADFTADLFKEVLIYSLTKLNQDYETLTNVCYLRLFCPLKHQNNIQMMFNVLEEIQLLFNVVYTVVPVNSLQNSSTLLSICGIRNE